MSHHKIPNLNRNGFTLIELLVVIVVVGVLYATFAEFFDNNLILFLNQQQNSMNLTELQAASQRIADVLRGTTDIVSDGPNQLSVYAYFSPVDNYVSLVNYYLNSSGTQLLASVTPMTSNPPIGTPITSETQIYTIISNYYNAPGNSLFTYYDLNGDILTPPVSNEQSIINIGINLDEPIANSSNNQVQSINLFVNLRNRKTAI